MAAAVAASTPRRAVMELRAWLAALARAPRVLRRGAGDRRRARVPRGRLAPLYLPRGESMRRRLDDAWTRLVADDEHNRRIRHTTWGIAGTRNSIEDVDYGRHVAWTLAVGAASVVLSLLALRSLFGRGALVGPGLLPLPEAWQDGWEAAWSTWVPRGLGVRGPGDPLVRLLGHLPTTGGTLVEVIVFTAVPLSALTAWWAAGALTRAVGARLALAVTWALAPSLLSAQGPARPGRDLGAGPLPAVGPDDRLLAAAAGARPAAAAGPGHRPSDRAAPQDRPGERRRSCRSRPAAVGDRSRPAAAGGAERARPGPDRPLRARAAPAAAVGADPLARPARSVPAGLSRSARPAARRGWGPADAHHRVRHRPVHAVAGHPRHHRGADPLGRGDGRPAAAGSAPASRAGRGAARPAAGRGRRPRRPPRCAAGCGRAGRRAPRPRHHGRGERGPAGGRPAARVAEHDPARPDDRRRRSLRRPRPPCARGLADAASGHRRARGRRGLRLRGDGGGMVRAAPRAAGGPAQHERAGPGGGGRSGPHRGAHPGAGPGDRHRRRGPREPGRARRGVDHPAVGCRRAAGRPDGALRYRGGRGSRLGRPAGDGGDHALR